MQKAEQITKTVSFTLDFFIQGTLDKLSLEKWPEHIGNLLAKAKKGSTLDAVIDSAGAEILAQVGKLLKLGGRVVCYGMLVSPVLICAHIIFNYKIQDGWS